MAARTLLLLLLYNLSVAGSRKFLADANVFGENMSIPNTRTLDGSYVACSVSGKERFIKLVWVCVGMLRSLLFGSFVKNRQGFFDHSQTL